MFVHSSRLPHVLEPSCYGSGEFYARELETLLVPGWHVVCSRDDLARPGDFLTLELFGRPIQLRNFDGEIRALSNVCAHRHCLISCRDRGNSSAMTCQYHGWEYGADGRTRRIPEPKNFVPFDRDVDRLAAYRVELCGSLVFVSVAPSGPTLREYLGAMYDRIADRFGPDWRAYLHWNPNYDANWKVPIENSLEAYHVPFVHPATFREDPGSDRSVHMLDPRHTWFGTSLPFSPHSKIQTLLQRGESWIVRRQGKSPEGRYEQHHLFPNLLFSFTDVVSVCQTIIPTGPRSCRAVVREFGRVTQQAGGLVKLAAAAWGRFEGMITWTIMREDLGMFAKIQRGLDASTHPGVLGACEERIWAFQDFVRRECGRTVEQNNTEPSSFHCEASL